MTQNITLSLAQIAAVTTFAKSRKLSTNALLEAAKMAVAMQPAPTPRATRQAGETSTAFRDAVVDKYETTLKGKKLTFAEVARMFNLDPANATNNLKWLKEQGKIAYDVVGKGEKAPGIRGPRPSLVEFK